MKTLGKGEHTDNKNSLFPAAFLKTLGNREHTDNQNSPIPAAISALLKMNFIVGAMFELLFAYALNSDV